MLIFWLNELISIIFDPTVSINWPLRKNKLADVVANEPVKTLILTVFWLFVDSKIKPVATGGLMPSVNEIELPAVNEAFLSKMQLITLIVEEILSTVLKLPTTFLSIICVSLNTSPIISPYAPLFCWIIISFLK